MTILREVTSVDLEPTIRAQTGDIDPAHIETVLAFLLLQRFIKTSTLLQLVSEIQFTLLPLELYSRLDLVCVPRLFRTPVLLKAMVGGVHHVYNVLLGSVPL